MLNLSQLNVFAQKKHILHDLNFSVNHCGFYALIGANGAGKSTLLSALAQVMPYSGSIRLVDEELREVKVSDLWSTLVYVDQNFSIIFDYTVEQYIRIGLDLYFDQDAIDFHAQHILGIFNAIEWLQVSILTLSQGQQQLVQLIRALTHVQCLLTLKRNNPQQFTINKKIILLLDEPLNHLDVKVQWHLLEYLKVLSKDIVLLCSLHQIVLAKKYADTLVILKAGRLISCSKSSQKSIQEVANIFEVDANFLLY